MDSLSNEYLASPDVSDVVGESSFIAPQAENLQVRSRQAWEKVKGQFSESSRRIDSIALSLGGVPPEVSELSTPPSPPRTHPVPSHPPHRLVDPGARNRTPTPKTSEPASPPLDPGAAKCAQRDRLGDSCTSHVLCDRAVSPVRNRSSTPVRHPSPQPSFASTGMGGSRDASPARSITEQLRNGGTPRRREVPPHHTASGVGGDSPVRGRRHTARRTGRSQSARKPPPLGDEGSSPVEYARRCMQHFRSRSSRDGHSREGHSRSHSDLFHPYADSSLSVSSARLMASTIEAARTRRRAEEARMQSDAAHRDGIPRRSAKGVTSEYPVPAIVRDYSDLQWAKFSKDRAKWQIHERNCERLHADHLHRIAVLKERIAAKNARSAALQSNKAKWRDTCHQAAVLSAMHRSDLERMALEARTAHRTTLH